MKRLILAIVLGLVVVASVVSTGVGMLGACESGSSDDPCK